MVYMVYYKRKGQRCPVGFYPTKKTARHRIGFNPILRAVALEIPNVAVWGYNINQHHVSTKEEVITYLWENWFSCPYISINKVKIKG